jgi:hypothetical protein
MLAVNQAEEKLLHPRPGGRIEAARAHGVDLTLLIERLRLTPEERVRDLQRAVRGLEAMRGKARRPPQPAAPVRQDAAQQEERD